MTAETEALTGAPGREVAETAALLVFVGSGISAVISLCMSASGSDALAALLGAAAVAGLTITTFSLHRLGRRAKPDE
jgi:hypothetical protein